MHDLAIKPSAKVDAESASLTLHQSDFFNQIICELSGALQDIVGTRETEGFITIVGSKLGDEIDRSYRSALRLDRLPRDKIPGVLVDLKRRIQGSFSVEYEDDEKIVLRNSRCPFGDRVAGRPSLCMMTTNVFGRIAANNLGYARIAIEQAIAKGDDRCRVVVHLTQGRAGDNPGIEFFDVGEP